MRLALKLLVILAVAIACQFVIDGGTVPTV